MHLRPLPTSAWCVAVLFSLIAPGTARALSYFWIGPSGGSWTVAANWSFTPGGAGGAGVPKTGDEAQAIGVISKIVQFNTIYAPPGLIDLYVTSQNNGSTITLNHDFGGMAASLAVIASGGRGVYNLNTGTATISDLRVGAAGPGTFNLNAGSGTNSLTSDVMFIGGSSGATGLFQQNGGAVTAGSIDIASAAGAAGTYAFAGGTISVGSILLHPGGTFTNSSAVPIRFTGFNQSGGTHNYGPLLYIAPDPLSIGTYTMSAGTLTGQFCKPGYQGTGTFTQSGGVFTPQELSVGEGTTGIGRFFMSNTASLTTNNMYVGVFGNGTFTQTGGDIKVTNLFTIVGRDPSGSGYYDQQGGTHTTVQLIEGFFAGGKGTYSLSGGTMTSTATPLIGQSGAGTFIQNGGQFTSLSTAEVGSGTTATGAYFLNGGNFNVADDITIGNYGAGSFNQSNGVYFTEDATYLGRQSGSTGAYMMTGGAFTSGATLTVGAAGSGTFTQNAGSLLTSTITIGANPASIGRFALSGPSSVTASTIYDAFEGNGTFTQGLGCDVHTTENTVVGWANGSIGHYENNGGTHEANAVILAYNAGSRGTYVLSGGTLTVFIGPYIGLNGAGTFLQSGGWLNTTGLSLASGGMSSGTYLMNAGTVSMLSGYIFVGSNGPGTVIQSGGLIAGGGTVQLSGTSFGQGTYLLQGGSLFTGGLLQIRFPGTFTWSGGTLGTNTVNLQAGLMQLTAGSHRVLRTNELTISGTGKLDLTDNSGIIDYTGASPAATIRSLIITGRAGGAWTGNGITSSSAAAAAASLHPTAVGYAEASDLFTSFPAMFMSQSVDSTSVLMRYLYTGDANLSGAVDSVDFNLLVPNFSQSGKSWVNGDFNYDSSVDSVDFNLLVSNFGQMLPAPAGPAGGEAGTPSTLVPEPATWACLLAAGFLIRHRRLAAIAGLR